MRRSCCVALALVSACAVEIAEDETTSELMIPSVPLGPFLQTEVTASCIENADQSCCRPGTPLVLGTAAADVMVHSTGMSCISARGAADTIHLLTPHNVALGGNGNDLIIADHPTRAHGGNGIDRFIGSFAADVAFGDGGDDRLFGNGSPDLLYGGDGNDLIEGGDANDRLVGGAGLDDVRGLGGDDTIVIASECEIVGGETIDGGIGNDVVVSPFTQAELGAMGVVIVGVERFDVAVPGVRGSCLLGTDQEVGCDCCDDPHYDAAQGCSQCESGYRLVGGHGPVGPELGAYGVTYGALDETLSCERAESCANFFCPPGSRCVDAPWGAHCECGPTASGPHCDECAYPYTRNPATGNCEIGPSCHADYCLGEGLCRQRRDGSVECVCPDGTIGCGQPGTPMPTFAVAPHPRDEVRLEAQPPRPGCGPLEWSVVGGGRVEATRTSARYHADFTPSGRVDEVIVRAVPDGCPAEAQEFHLPVLAAGSPQATGEAGGDFEPLDEAILQYMDYHDVRGASVTVTFQGQRVYNRAFGEAHPGVPMRPSNYQRVGSVTKPITKAAIRQLAFEGGLSADLSDLVWPILQGGGSDVLGIGADLVPGTPLALNEYVSSPVPTLVDGVVTPVVWRAGGSGNLNSTRCRTINPVDRRYDARWAQMTVADLFNHLAGFNRSAGFVDVASSNPLIGDITGLSTYIANRYPLIALPPTDRDMAAMMATTCFYYTPRGGTDTVPGQRPRDPWGFMTELPGGDTYSNVGYSLLGLVIEAQSGQSYGDYVRDHLLMPYGIDEIELARTRPGDRHPREVSYRQDPVYTGGDLFSAVCSEPEDPYCVAGDWEFPNQVPLPDGGNEALEFRDAHGGHIATTCGLADYMQVYRLLDGRLRAPYSWPTGGEGMMFGALYGLHSMVWQLPASIDIRTPTPGTADYTSLPTHTVNISPGYHVAVLLNGQMKPGDADDYDDGIHDLGALPDLIAAALDVIDGQSFDSVGCPVCGDGVREGDESCDGEDFGGIGCANFGYEMGYLTCDEACRISSSACEIPSVPVPLGEDTELQSCSDMPGTLGCTCAATDPSALHGCALGDAWDCERSQPDGPFFPEAFCEGEDIVCGITNGGNPICRQCGSGDGEAQEGCPCDVVGDCEMYGLGCWGDGWGVTGRCWDQEEPPDHICIEECSELHDDAGYQLVCVGPHTGHDDGTPHSVGSQFAGHPSYCTTDNDCGTFTFCEVNGGNVCTWTESSGYECGAQCESDGACADRGYPSWYSCSSSNRCVPETACDGLGSCP